MQPFVITGKRPGGTGGSVKYRRQRGPTERRRALLCRKESIDVKKLLFIYNPLSGVGQLKPKLADVLDIFVKAGYEVTVYPTQKYHDALDKTRTYTGEYDLVVCSGGDGTLDEVVSGMENREKKVPIGYIPTGTTNDFASSLHISRNILEAADTAVNGIPFACDVGRFNDDFFIYIAAFGLFTDVSYLRQNRV